MLPERRRLEAASKSTMTEAEYVRAKWGLELLRKSRCKTNPEHMCPKR
jgi:hypothetical protein